jgi:AcrR family transcriptional regulator
MPEIIAKDKKTDKKTPLRERNRARNCQDLIDAAIKFIDEKGYEETTISDIVDEVGMSYSSFFRYFKSKEDLVLSIEHVGWESYSATVDVLLSSSDDPFQATLEGEISSYRAFDSDIERAIRIIKNQKLIYSNPLLHAQYLLRDAERTEIIGKHIADRIGANYDTDYLLRHWIARMSMAGHLAFKIVVESYEDGNTIRALDVFQELLVESHLIEDCERLSQEYSKHRALTEGSKGICRPKPAPPTNLIE